tara:strand:+ start:565 stop:1446 length:882 start_codon:yes stop_codon:yes gene_type:complete
MSYLKGLTSKDVIVSPLTVNKDFSVTGEVPSEGDDSFQIFVENLPYTGGQGIESSPLVFNSIKQLYYTNFISGSNGLLRSASLPSYNKDGTSSGEVLNTIYQNNISSIDELRYFPTVIPEEVGVQVFSIPRKQVGDNIKPGSFSDDAYSDDGEGNIKQGNDQVGNIIYSAGLIILTGDNGEGFEIDDDPITNPSWKSSYTIFETQYKCTIEANEFNYSMNPSLLSSSLKGQGKIRTSGSAYYENYVTGSDFTPFVTTVGLYNNDKELIAVGKLSQPLTLSSNTDTTILVNIDR